MSVCVLWRRSPSNIEEKWNLDESVGLCPIIQPKVPSWLHKRTEDIKMDKQKAPVFTFLCLFITDSINPVKAMRCCCGFAIAADENA